jgi:hypothetical protein
MQQVFRSTTHNFAWSAEMGIQFYFNKFKLTPAIRGTFFMNNEMVADNATTPPYWVLLYLHYRPEHLCLY